jgi:hypothetical protein
MKPLRLVVAIGAVGAAAALSGIAWSNAQADLLLAHASGEMATWSSRSVVGESWDWVRDDLQRAAALDPTDPSIHELLGLLKARRLDRHDLVQQSTTHFSRALELRPVSPYAWAHLARASYRLGDTGAGFEAALRRSAGMGPAEPQIQQMVADLGLAVYGEASPETRQAVDRMVGFGLRRNPLEMLRISERRGRLDVACRRMGDDADLPAGKRWPEVCDSREKEP